MTQLQDAQSHDVPAPSQKGPRSSSPRSSIASQARILVYMAVVGLGLTAVIIYSRGYAPIPTIGAGLEYALGDSTRIARTIAWGIPLYVAALGVAIAFRSGMFNIGAEGQIYAGAMAAAIVGAHTGAMFSPAHLAITTLVAGAIGAVIAGGLGWLRAAWGVDEVLSTLLSNYLVMLGCTYLAMGPLRDTSRQSGTTHEIAETARFPELISGTGLTAALFVVVAIALAAWWISEQSTLGYRWRMTGESAPFASSVGINIKSARIGAMAVSGAMCGIAGSFLVTASQGRFWTEIGTGIGWDAVLMALVARARPVLAVVWVTIYCVMRSSARGIEQVSEVPAELSLILVSAIIIAAAARAQVFARLAVLGRRLHVTGRN